MENNLENEKNKNDFDMFISAMNKMVDLHIKMLKNELKQRPFIHSDKVGSVCVN